MLRCKAKKLHKGRTVVTAPEQFVRKVAEPGFNYDSIVFLSDPKLKAIHKGL